MIVTVDAETREQLVQKIMELPPESVREVEEFLDFLRYRHERRESRGGVTLGGLLEGYRFTLEEIAQARQEMWGSMDDRHP